MDNAEKWPAVGPGITQPAPLGDAMKQFHSADYAITSDGVHKDGDFRIQEKSASNSDTNSDLGDSSLKHTETTLTTYDQEHSGMLYRDGKLIVQPAPSQDPRDPLNMSTRRKFIAVLCMCFFGAFAAAAELILGAMLPVFALEYAGIRPVGPFLLAISNGGLPSNADPLLALESLPNAPPIWHIYLLASLPVLMIGIANLFLIPAAIAVGRRPIILISGVIAIGGCIWAGFSQSLSSHLGARSIQAIGAGTVESLIPFIIQDMVFVHQRNSWISMLFACQGAIIIALGIGSPYIIIYLNWRYVYYITAAVAGGFLVGVYFFLPETRWQRTRAEMNGVPKIVANPPTEPRTFAYNVQIFTGKQDWRKGWNAFVDTLRTFFYPQIFFITMLNSAMIACAFAAGYTVSPALLTQPWAWPFLHLGLCLLPILIAALFVGFLTGVVADWTANWAAKKRGKRIPENQLLNLIIPTAAALVGSVIFGLAGSHEEDYHWMVFLLGLALMAFGFLGANTVGAVYVLECYPHLAGPSLVNIASFRCLIAFVLSFKVSEWVAHLGYFNSMMIYTGLMAFFAALIPVVYIYGPAWRKRWPAEHFGEH